MAAGVTGGWAAGRQGDVRGAGWGKDETGQAGRAGGQAATGMREGAPCGRAAGSGGCEGRWGGCW